MSSVAPSDKSTDTSFFGHPRMLANLFSVEMWERFSYYGMQAIMLYYLYFSIDKGGLGLDKASAAGVIGSYGGMVYLLAILGGFLGDRVLGPERTLFYSAIVIMLGHVSLALIPGVAGVVTGLILIALGSGCLKTNSTVLVGSLYDEKDRRRDGGFTIFYMGVNLGGLLGPLLTGWFQERWGFHVGFGLAAIGMALGLIQYGMTRKNLPASVHQLSNPLTPAEKTRSIIVGVAIVVVLAALVIFKAITPFNLVYWVLSLVAVFSIGLFAILLTSKKTTADEHSRVVSFIPMFICNVVFWALFQQQSSVLAIYSETRVNWVVGGIKLPDSWVQSFNPLFIILLGAVFTAMWTKLGDRQPATPQKFSLGAIFMGVAFLIFLLPAGQSGISPLWPMMIMFVATLGELSISPVGQSLVSRIAPKAHRVYMMALYFCSVSLGTVLSGRLAGLYSEDNEVTYFLTLGLISIAVGLVMFGLNKWVLKKMVGIR